MGNGAIKSGLNAAEWGPCIALCVTYTEFSCGSPAHRADYTASIGSVLFPLKHIIIKWVEIVARVGRALYVYDDIESIIGSKSFKTIAEGTTVVFMKCKLYFFKNYRNRLSHF